MIGIIETFYKGIFILIPFFYSKIEYEVDNAPIQLYISLYNEITP